MKHEQGLVWIGACFLVVGALFLRIALRVGLVGRFLMATGLLLASSVTFLQLDNPSTSTMIFLWLADVTFITGLVCYITVDSDKEKMYASLSGHLTPLSVTIADEVAVKVRQTPWRALRVKVGLFITACFVACAALMQSLTPHGNLLLRINLLIVGIDFLVVSLLSVLLVSFKSSKSSHEKEGEKTHATIKPEPDTSKDYTFAHGTTGPATGGKWHLFNANVTCPRCGSPTPYHGQGYDLGVDGTLRCSHCGVLSRAPRTAFIIMSVALGIVGPIIYAGIAMVLRRFFHCSLGLALAAAFIGTIVIVYSTIIPIMLRYLANLSRPTE